MKKFLVCFAFVLSFLPGFAQSRSDKIRAAFQTFEADSQLRSAIASLYIIQSGTGQVVFDRNSKVGLAPASTQKVITSATAYALLGKDFRYQTLVGYDGLIRNGRLEGNLYIEGAGDPTLGSTRWTETRDSAVFKKLKAQLQKAGIRSIHGDIWINGLRNGMQPVPDGWIWQDIGNYYGAGAWGLSWRENQYDLILNPGNSPGEPAEIVRTRPVLQDFRLQNLLRTGAKGSGDNAYIYAAPFSKEGIVSGTIPLGENNFVISGSIAHPPRQFGAELSAYLTMNSIPLSGQIKLYSDSIVQQMPVRKVMRLMDSISSPVLDSMNYWFLTRSINLYGEALLRTLAYQKDHSGSGATGIAVIKNFWKDKGIDESELNMMDGSGLSPQNRVTTRAQVNVLQYAQTQSWFEGYYKGFPMYNGMKMKSGTINGAKAFCGYQHAASGEDYIFSFIVNNYNGSSSALVKKMYLVLNELK